jgi:hypothetical protein
MWLARNFLVAGIPGLILAPVLLMTLREPGRGLADKLTHSYETAKSSLMEIIRFVLAAALSQGVTLPYMRTTPGAIFLMITNLIGLDPGPLGPGLLSDI